VTVNAPTGRLRSNDETRHVPIIFATGFKQDQMSVFDGYEMGAVDYLLKPIAPQVLRAKLNVFLALHAQKSELRAINDKYRCEIEIRQSAEAKLELRVDQLRTVNLQLAEKNTELDDFTYMASHDLQEPLRKMVSFGQMLRLDAGENLSDDAEADVTHIISAATRMKTLIQDLLMLSRAGREALHYDVVSLDDCVDEALDVMSERIDECGATISRDDLPDVVGERTLLTQLYQNLISNALKFVDEASPEIHITAEQEGDSWTLGVRDNGIGMDPRFAKDIFKPFRRLHARTEYSGTGIGLAICKKAATRHGGQIWVESEAGQGAHFKFKLRDVDEPDEEATCLFRR
jgi:light-regulated signal transduction histidine kinase (bacteriophytochrome)